MSKKILVVIILFLILIISIVLVSSLTKNDNDKLKIVTSFYPTYIIVSNLTKDIPNVEVSNIATSTTGCIHDYTLTPGDMTKIEKADILVVNGAGMEGFMNDITENYPQLDIVDASKDIKLLVGSEHEHHHEEEEEEHEEPLNAHVWMNPIKYIEQIKNVSSRLIETDPNNKNKYEENTTTYINKINNLITTMNNQLSNIKEKKVIIFHDAFQYLADYLHLNIVHTVYDHEDVAFSASEIEEIVNEINENGVKALLVEKQFSNSVINTIKNEVNVQVYTLNTGVTGDTDLDSYIKAMMENIDVLKEVYND